MTNRSRAVLCVQGRVRDVSRRVRDGSWTTKNRSKADLGTPRTGQERPRAVQKRARDGPKTLPDRPGAMSECIRSIEHCRTTPQNDFSLFSCRRAKAPMCCSYQFLRCFVGFERCKQRTRARRENVRKSRRFGLQNRARERPGDPKSSPGGSFRAPKREKVARSFTIF